MSLTEKRYLHHCSLRSEKNQRTWDKLTLSWRKFVTSSVLFHTNKYGETRVRTKFKFGSKKDIKATWKTSKSEFSLKDKKSKFLLDPEARTSSRFWQKKYPGIELELLILSE